MNGRCALFTAVGMALILSGHVFGQALEVDKEIGGYSRTSGVAGNLNSIGSDTLNNLMTLWAEGFKREYPNVKIQIEGKGSSTAPPALIEGSAQIGPMSRTMKPSEEDQFEQKFGYKPTQIRVAIDALAVYVNKDNPIEKLTLPQVDAIFSATRRCGEENQIDRWGALGLTGPWGARHISLYGRNSASGTYGYFKKHALCKGDYLDTVKEQPGSASVVQGITEDISGIGYSGIGYMTSGVKAVSLAKKDGDTFYSTDVENVLSGKYPLARFLYLYINKEPGKPVYLLTREFVKYILSHAGQEIVIKDGYVPVPYKVTEAELAKLN